MSISHIPAFDIPASQGRFLLEKADLSVLRDALFRNEASTSGISVEMARIGMTPVLNQLDDQSIRMLVLETVAMNNPPHVGGRVVLKIDRDGHYLLSENGITHNKSLDNPGHERGI